MTHIGVDRANPVIGVQGICPVGYLSRRMQTRGPGHAVSTSSERTRTVTHTWQFHCFFCSRPPPIRRILLETAVLMLLLVMAEVQGLTGRSITSISSAYIYNPKRIPSPQPRPNEEGRGWYPYPKEWLFKPKQEGRRRYSPCMLVASSERHESSNACADSRALRSKQQ